MLAQETAVIASRTLAELKERLSEADGERLQAVVLCGFEARGDARPASDIDVMAVLDHCPATAATNWREDLPRCIRLPCGSVAASA